MLTLGIETSCDETAMAVVRNGAEILSNVVSSQVTSHAEHGGIVPELAARMHTEIINIVLKQALDSASIKPKQLDIIAVTTGPGLIVSLVVGISCARSLATILRKPVIGVNHLEAHILSNYLCDVHPPLPSLCLLVSGGHTEIVLMKAIGEYEILGCTRDDAAGEAFDKVARLLGLTYPGGPAISNAAEAAGPESFSLPRPMLHDESLDFSFSGLKTSVVNLLKKMEREQRTVPVPEIAAEFQNAVVDVLTRKTMKAAVGHGAASVLLCGGVAANQALRDSLQRSADNLNLPFYCPDFSLCTDNAAMVACAGYHNFIHRIDKLPLSPQPNISL